MAKSNKTNTEYFINAAKKAEETIARIEHLDLGKQKGFVILSFSNEDTAYHVTYRKRMIGDVKVPFITGCSCPHYEFRRIPCKHMIAVSLENNIGILALARDLIEKLNKEHKKKKKQLAM